MAFTICARWKAGEGWFEKTPTRDTSIFRCSVAHFIGRSCTYQRNVFVQLMARMISYENFRRRKKKVSKVLSYYEFCDDSRPHRQFNMDRGNIIGIRRFVRTHSTTAYIGEKPSPDPIVCVCAHVYASESQSFFPSSCIDFIIIMIIIEKDVPST